MIQGLPGILAIAALGVVAVVAFLWAYRWHKAVASRPGLHLDVAALSLLGLLTGGFFWRPLTEEAVSMPAGGGDLASLYFPTYSYVASQIKAGSIPLWNPYLFSGMPTAADVQTGIFYPINWMLYLFTNIEYRDLEWLLVAHYWLAAAFTYLFLRDIGLRRVGALAGGVAFAFSGFMVAHLGHLPMVLVATWIPLVLLTLRRAYISHALAGWVWAIVAGLCLTMSLLAGHVQIFSYGLMAAGLLWLFLLFQKQPLTGKSTMPWVAKGALIVAIALGIGAVQLLPSVELSAQSSRSTVSYEEASQFPDQPVTLLNMVLPTVYGSNPTNYAFGQYQTTENWGYSGVVTIALALAGLALRRKRMLGFFAALVILALLLMVGDLSILGAWIYKFAPGFNKLRDAGRALVLLSFGLAGLAAYGLDGLQEALSGKQTTARRNAMWWLVGLSGAVVIAVFGVMPAFYKEILLNNGAENSKMPGAINNLGMLVLWLGALAGVGWAAYRARIGAGLMAALVVGLLVLDIFSPNSRFNPTTVDIQAGYKNFDAIALLEKATINKATGVPMRIDSDTDVQNIWQPATALLISSRNADAPLYDTGGAFNPLEVERYNTLWEQAKRNQNSPLYDLTGALFQVASTVITHENQAKWSLVEGYNGFNVYTNKNAMPRLFLVHDARIEADGQKTVDIISTFGIEPRHTVMLASGTPVTSAAPGTAETQASPTGESVRATRYTANAVDISVNATSPGWVVLTDVWYPGWQAKVDGLDVPVEQADYAYRAIKVETGQHTISMQFRPNSWTTGRLISLLSALAVIGGLAVLLAWPWIKRSRRR